jgi:hypothetical protein
LLIPVTDLNPWGFHIGPTLNVQTILTEEMCMRPFPILISLFLVLNLSFTVTAVSISDSAIVSAVASGEGPDGPGNALNLTDPFDTKSDSVRIRMAQNANTLKAEAAFTLSPGGG